MTERQYELQGELIQDAMAFFDEQFDKQNAIQQPVIDQQLETLINQSEFAKAQQQRYLEQGVPAQQAAAQALTDMAQTPEGEKFISDLNTAFAETGNTAGEQAFRQALTNYGVAPQEVDYLSSLSNYGDPQILKDKLAAATEYQDPTQVQTAIDNLSNFDSTARVREAEAIAGADVAASGEAARQAAMQQLEKYGIDPSQIASGALDRTLRAQTAAQASLASSQARRDIQARGVGMDVEAAGIASQSQLRELQTQLQAAEGLMQSRVRELQMQGMGAEEARMQADREIGYSQQLANLEAAQRQEQIGYSGAASAEANQQQARETAGLVDAYNIYAGNPTTSAQAFGTAGSAGGQAAAIAGSQTQQGMGAYGTISGMYGDAAGTLNAGYGTANSIYGNQIASAQYESQAAAGPWNLAGSLVGTLGGAAIGSDERIKTDVKKVGKTDEGLPIYTYKYKGQEDGPTQMGVMAQDVKQTHPEAVVTNRAGIMGVDYKKLEGGGPVPQEWSPSRGAIPDDITAQVSAGEYMFPDDVARWYGEEKLNKMVEKARTDRQGKMQEQQALRTGVPGPGTAPPPAPPTQRPQARSAIQGY